MFGRGRSLAVNYSTDGNPSFDPLFENILGGLIKRQMMTAWASSNYKTVVKWRFISRTGWVEGIFVSFIENLSVQLRLSTYSKKCTSLK